MDITDGFPAGAKEQANKIKREERESAEAEAYLTEGTPELRAARLWIASHSIPKAKSRIAAAKRKREHPTHPLSLPAANLNNNNHLSPQQQAASFARFINTTSEIGDERPLVAIGFAPNSRTVATGAWSGMCKLWEISAMPGGGATCRHVASLRGHSERIHDLSFHPLASLSLSPSVVNFATCSSDRTARLWGLAPSSNDASQSNGSSSTTDNHTNTTVDTSASISYLSPLATLTGHEDRVNGIGFHPSGRY